MQDDITYLRTRVDGIADTLAKNTVVLEANTESLREHIRRTDLLEKQMDTALIPIKAIKIGAYLLGLLGTIFGGIMAIREWFKF